MRAAKSSLNSSRYAFVIVYVLNMASYPSPMSLLFIFLCCFICSSSDLALPQRHPSTASLKTRWTNSGLENGTDTSKFKLVVWERLDNTSFSDGLPICVGAGFFCNNTCNRSLFAVLLILMDDENKTSNVVVAWSANRNRLVGENATLELKADGDLVLKDSDGSLVWSTSTSHKGVLGMTIRSSGNLVLFNSSNQTVWQSFDHPTDTLMVDQRLSPGQKLVADDSPTNTSEGVFSLSIIPGGFAMFAGAQMFYRHILLNETALCYLQLVPQGLSVFHYPAGEPAYTSYWYVTTTSGYIKLELDGHLIYWGRDQDGQWWHSEVTDLLSDDLQFCDYPGMCKGYSICTSGQCTCSVGADASDSFIPANNLQPRLGCFPPTPPAGCDTTNRSAGQHFLELEQVSYFNHIIDNHSLISNSTTMDECKKICYNRCSCESAFFVYNGTNNSHGSCFLPSNVFSLLQNVPNSTSYNSYAFLKVQNRSTATPGKSHFPRASIAVISAAAGAGAAGCALVFLWLHRSKTTIKETLEDDEDFDYETVPGLPVRFSYNELRSATQDFSTKLGGGGFGSVFAGILPNGTKIAVKRLEYSEGGQGIKEFRAEVQTIGGINHFNLVKLQGFCADRSHRLLVYEHLENGSLDKWLFPKNSERILDWNARFKIALDSARGLAYLHGDCRECIIHLDVKPQNILLDDKFNAKISDFGLSRLMNRDESQVMTRVRGTPGYMAPELLKYSKVTEKADIYSFGITLLEIVSGRRNVDLSARSMSDIFLLDTLPQKAKEGKLLHVVDEQLHEEYENIEKEVLRMIKVGMWCIQEDFRIRPPMSVIVKVFEGITDLEDPPWDFRCSTAPSPAVSSGSSTHSED